MKSQAVQIIKKTNVDDMSFQTQKTEEVKNKVLYGIKKDFRRNRILLFMSIPFVLYYIMFHYVPMYGVIIAFKNYSPAKGIFASEWIGFRNFIEFFNSYYFVRILRNTILINVYQLIFGFPAPIILAILLNEVKNKYYKSLVQTISYMPHFISTVVICGMVIEFVSKDGFINDILELLGMQRVNLLMYPQYFRTIYVTTGIWQGIGWNSIIYLAAFSTIDSELYEAAIIDGANRFKRFVHVTFPGILPTIIVLLIMNIGRIMSEGAEKVILLYNPNIYETADIISSFVYRRGIIESNYSFSSAVGLFNSVINLILLISANFLSRKINEISLW